MNYIISMDDEKYNAHLELPSLQGRDRRASSGHPIACGPWWSYAVRDITGRRKEREKMELDWEERVKSC